MTIIRRLVFADACAGLLTAFLVTVMHYVGTVPVILQAEVYERAVDAKRDAGRGSESGLFGLHRAYGNRRPMRVGYPWEGCSVREAASRPRLSSLGLKGSQTQQGQPVRMTLTRHQLPRALALALGMTAAQEAAVVQEEAQQVQVRATEVPAQGELCAQPGVEVLAERAAARCLRHGPAHGGEQGVKLAPDLHPQPVPPLPVCGRGAGQAVQHAGVTHEGLGDGAGARDVGQLAIEHAGEGEQGVALVLQRDTHRADASEIRGLALRQLLDEEVEQRLPGGQGRAGQCQNVMAQPLGERPDVAGQFMCLGLGLPGLRQLGGELVVGTTLAGVAGPGL